MKLSRFVFRCKFFTEAFGVLASCSVTPNPLRYCATMTCSLHYDVTHITRDISISDPHDNSFSYVMCTHTTTVTVIPLVIQSGEVDVELL